MWSSRNSHCCWESNTDVQPLWKTVSQLLTKLTVLLIPCDPANVLAIHLDELKTGPCKNQHTNGYGSIMNNCYNLERSPDVLRRRMGKLGYNTSIPRNSVHC